MNVPLLRKSTAIWLLENTTLTFEQIALFCDLHLLEIKAIADGEVAANMRGVNPVQLGELSLEEIKRCENDPNAQLKLVIDHRVKQSSGKSVSKYTPLARRQNKPNAVMWLIKNHPELSDAQIIKLVQTTKPTIKGIRERTHWNYSNLRGKDPVLLGFCTQSELEFAIAIAKKKSAATSKDGGISGGGAR